MAVGSQPELPLRIIVEDPLPGVTLRLQKGKGELVEPTSATKKQVVFDFSVRVELRGVRATPNFLGPFTQGPPAARFVYVNAGQSAGQADSPWSRRAKIPLMGITAVQVQAALASGSRLEVRFDGQGRDGGPTCATVPLPDDAWQMRPSRR
jgi:hypothetical protein